MRVAHLAFDLRTRHERGDRVDDDHVERARADEHVGDLERLLTGVGLRDVEVVDVHADGRGVHRVHRVLGVDVGADTTVALRLGDHVHGERGLARRLGTEHLDHAAAGEAADAEGDVERERAGGDGRHTHVAPLPQPHDGALAVVLLDLAERHLEGLVSFHGGTLLCLKPGCLDGSAAGKPSRRKVRRGCDSYAETTPVELSRTPVRSQAPSELNLRSAT